MKITLHQLRIYDRFNGDDDMFGRCGSADEKALIDDAVWRRITELVQAFSVASSPWGAEQFRASVEANLHDACATPEAEALFRQIAASGRDR